MYHLQRGFKKMLLGKRCRIIMVLGAWLAVVIIFLTFQL